MSTNPRHVNICTYRVKEGHEAEMEALLAKHWPALREAGLASEDPPLIYRGLPPRKPGERHGAKGVYVEIFSWALPDGPDLAHQTPEVMAVWEPMGAICEEMDFPMFEPFDPGRGPLNRASKAERTLADVDAVFGALAHPSRRHILLVLHYRGGEMTAGEIAGRFECSWPTTTRHLKVLLEAGLVEMEQSGRQRNYRLNRERLDQVTSGWLGSFENG